MQTIPESEPLVALQVEVREDIRAILKSKAALVRKTMGEYITDLIERDTLLPPAATNGHEHQPASKQKGRQGDR